MEFVGLGLVASYREISYSVQSRPPRGKQHAYSLADVLLGSVATHIKACMSFEARCQNFVHRFKLL